MTDTITILRACRGYRLAKLIRAGGVVENYDAGFIFDLISHPVADLDALHRLLHRLLRRPECAVVRGVPIDPDRCAGVRRLAHRCKRSGDEPTLRDAAHGWLALDLDGVERPAAVPAADLPACATAAIQRLPTAFCAAAVIIQATASHGIKPGSRLRLWYWLSRLTTGSELTRWLRGTPVDVAVFRPVQPIYTAAPVFAPDVHDHLPERITLLPGMPTVTVPTPEALAPPPPRPTPPMPRPTNAGAGAYAFAALANAASRVQQAGIGQRHNTMLREARGLVRFINAGLLTQSVVSETLCGVGISAGMPEAEIEAITAWATDHPSGAALPESVTK